MYVCVYVPTPNKVRSDDFPVMTLEFPKDLCHDILRSALGANAQVPLGSLHCPQGFRHAQSSPCTNLRRALQVMGGGDC